MLSNYTITSINSITKITEITTSGISSGGFMAQQLHIALSSIISGIAIFAAGPYMCALNNLFTAETQCMNNIIEPNINLLVDITNTYAFDKLIDEPKNLYDDKVFIFSGRLDSVVSPNIVYKVNDYYSHYIPNSNIFLSFNELAEHCQPTLNYGELCSNLSSPYIGNCNYDGAGEALKYLLNVIKRGLFNQNNLYSFDQTKYFTKNSKSINDIGYIYIPNNCKYNKCHLHISFHGCLQNIQFIGNQYAMYSGYNEWAETNNIIVLYPYVKPLPDINPNGCWDWWGYTNEYYATKNGEQIRFIYNIINSFMI